MPETETLTAAIRDQIEPVAHQFVGLSVGMVARGTQATVGFGRTREDGPVPGARTSFQIGSITKVFTSLLLAEAAHRGEVELDQPVDSLIEGTARYPRRRPITLLDLATHVSGLPRLPPGFRRQALLHRSDPYAGFTTQQLTRALTRTPRRPPGGRARYSNFGAGVLGEALVRAAGMPYDRLVATRVTGPLGMDDTVVDADPAAEQVAVGHLRPGRPVGDWHFAALAGAGALRSTATDLLTFVRAHLHPDEHPLAGAVRIAMEPRAEVSSRLRVGLGWHVVELQTAPPVWWHNGGTGGFFGFVAFDPAADVGVVLLTNTARPVDRLGMELVTRAQALVA